MVVCWFQISQFVVNLILSFVLSCFAGLQVWHLMDFFQLVCLTKPDVFFVGVPIMKEQSKFLVTSFYHSYVIYHMPKTTHLFRLCLLLLHDKITPAKMFLQPVFSCVRCQELSIESCSNHTYSTTEEETECAQKKCH